MDLTPRASRPTRSTMQLSVHALAIGTFVPSLKGLAGLLDKGAQHAADKGFDVSVLAASRLAPDMFTLAQQVQLACHHAKDAVARLTGEAPLVPAGAEESYADLRARVDATVAALEAAPEAAFGGAGDRDVVIVVPRSDVRFEMKGPEFVRDWAIPHFYFHVVTAYAILRHNGVDIGKRDYVRGVGRYLKPAAPRAE
jgi:hypothetical protein